MNSCSSSDEQPPQRKNLFKKLAISDSESEQSSSAESLKSLKIVEIKKSTQKKSRKQTTEEDFDFDGLLENMELVTQSAGECDSFLRIDRAWLNPASEAKKLFGKKSSISKIPRNLRNGRKLWLVTPTEEENWPIVRDNLKMFEKKNSKTESFFYLQPTKEYEKLLVEFVECLLSQDPQNLMEFVSRNPYHPHALLQLGEVFRQHSRFEDAYAIVRRALYSLECGFSFKFIPENIKRIEKETSGSEVMNPILIRGLLFYCHLLVGRGCVGTSFAVCLLGLALEMESVDSGHWLLRIDGLAVRAKRWDILNRIDLEWLAKKFKRDKLPSLSLILPNFAFSVALAKYLQQTDSSALLIEARSVTVAELLIESGELSASALLVRACLLFPGALRFLIGKIGEAGNPKWLDVFANLGTLGPQLNIGRVYSEHMFLLWKSDVLKKWLLAAAERSVELISKDTQVEIAIWRDKIESYNAEPELQSFLNQYKDVVAAEFLADTASFLFPKKILVNEEILIRVYGGQVSEARGAEGALGLGGALGLRGARGLWDSRGAGFDANISLDSNPVLVFLQSLLPWGRVDRIGDAVTPVNLGQIMQGWAERLGLGGAGNARGVARAGGVGAGGGVAGGVGLGVAGGVGVENAGIGQSEESRSVSPVISPAAPFINPATAFDSDSSNDVPEEELEME